MSVTVSTQDYDTHLVINNEKQNIKKEIGVHQTLLD